MIPNVGSKNIPSCPVMSTTPNAGDNFFHHCPAISKILIVGKNYQSTPEKPLLVKSLTNSQIPNDSWMKRGKGSETNMKRRKTLQKKRLNKQNNILKKQLRKSNKRLSRLRKDFCLLLDQKLQERNLLLRIKLKQSKTK